MCGGDARMHCPVYGELHPTERDLDGGKGVCAGGGGEGEVQ